MHASIASSRGGDRRWSEECHCPQKGLSSWAYQSQRRGRSLAAGAKRRLLPFPHHCRTSLLLTLWSPPLPDCKQPDTQREAERPSTYRVTSFLSLSLSLTPTHTARKHTIHLQDSQKHNQSIANVSTCLITSKHTHNNTRVLFPVLTWH